MQFRDVLDAALRVAATRAGLARRLGVARVTIHRWLNGTSVPSYEQALGLAKVTRLDAAVVLAATGHDATLLPDAKQSAEERIRVRAELMKIFLTWQELPAEERPTGVDAFTTVVRALGYNGALEGN